MKNTFTLFLILFFSVSMFSMPAKKGVYKATSQDGKEIQILKFGDENFHYTTDLNGSWLKQNSQGLYVPAQALSQSQIKERKANPRKVRKAHQHGVQRVTPARVLVILAQYSDRSFREGNDAAAYDALFNADNYSFNGATGSVGKYFRDQSYGQYVPQFDVVGPVTLPNKQNYYGKNDEYGDDQHPEQMIADACEQADKNLNVNFTKYDSDGDGYVDCVYVIYAGKGEADSPQEDAIWPHNARIEDSWDDIECVLDGKRVNVYVCSSETDDNGYREGIGTICHEFSHVLGLPDLYDTNDGEQKTLGEWDLMDYGGYNNLGRTPPAYSAYERFYMGWVEPIPLNPNEPLNLILRNLNTTGDCALICKTGQPNLNGLNPDPREFYLLENRQQSGWDTYIPGHGMLMTKIEFLKNKWEQNIVNNVPSNMCVDIIEADGSAPSYRWEWNGKIQEEVKNGYRGKQKDMFPAGGTSWKFFSNTQWFDNVTEKNEVIFLDYMGGVQKSTVTFFAGQNGTCKTASLTESSKRSGIILPDVTPKTDYTFLGWASKKSSTTPDAGIAGERYFPMSDCTVFALYRNNKRVDINYSLKGVEWNSGATYYADRNQDFEITFTPKAGYAIPSEKTCQVRITCGSIAMPNYSFENGMVVVRFSGKDVVDNIYITINNSREQGENGCLEYTHAFNMTCYEGTQDLSGYDWLVRVTEPNTLSYDKSKGAVFGSSNYPSKNVSLKTEETIGCGVVEVEITASTGSQGDAELDVYLAGNPIGETEYLTTENQTYTFTATEPTSGVVEIRLSNTAKAMYLKNINIKFEKLPGIETDVQNADFVINGSVYATNGTIIVQNFEKGTNINVYDLFGRLVVSKTTNEETLMLPLSEGVYLVQVVLNGKTKTYKLTTY